VDEQKSSKCDSTAVLQILKQPENQMRKYVIVACLVLCCGAGQGRAQAPVAKSTTAGVFTEEQAKKGAAAYNANCASCHGYDLNSTDREFPNLTGGSFTSAWVGKTIAEKFEITRETMPPKEERSLDDQVYLDIVTYILRFNKIPSGDQTLKPDVEFLRQIVISTPPG
jgi:S-disulfanyl-L-cysteine oxidoreductase SoxD